MYKNKFKGFTLIEVILSITLLGIISMFILPMSIYGVKYAKWNNIKFTAMNLAYSQVEWLKTLDYDDLGLNTLNYSPFGIVNARYYMNDENSNPLIVDGIEYRFFTSIYWESAKSTTGEPVQQATKKIDVTVEAKDPFTGINKKYSVLGTLIARESERDFTEPGELRIYTFFQGSNTPQKNVLVKMNNGVVAYTDNEGKAVFGDLKEGTYKVEPIQWAYDELMAMPNGINNIPFPHWKIEQELKIPKWDKKNPPIYPSYNFFIDLPGYIRLPENNNYPNAQLSIKPTSGSYNPSEGENLDNMLLKTNLDNLNQIKFWRLWIYEYRITYEDEVYFLAERENGHSWNGEFNVDKVDEISNQELSLAFGLEEKGTFRNTNGEDDIYTEIFIEFTSQVYNFEEMIFSIDGNIIDRKDYSINQVFPNRNDSFKIVFNSPISIMDNTINFEIINGDSLINQYGMKLAIDLNKCVLKLKN